MRDVAPEPTFWQRVGSANTESRRSRNGLRHRCGRKAWPAAPPTGLAASLAVAMGRRAPRRTEKERHAIVDAILDQGMTAKQAVEAAAQGRLGLPAFKVSLTSAKVYAQQARLRRNSVRLGELPDDEWLAETTAGFKAEIRRRAQQLAGKREYEEADYRNLATLIRATRDLPSRRGMKGRSDSDSDSDSAEPESADHSDLTPLERQLLGDGA